MQRIHLEIHEQLPEILDKIYACQESDVTLEIPEGSVLFDNYLSLKILKEESERKFKKIYFSTVDPLGLKLIQSITEDFPVGMRPISPIATKNPPVKQGGKRLKSPKIKFKFPSHLLKGRKKLAPVVFVALLLGASPILLLLSKRSGQVTLYLSSQTLTKSATIVVKEGAKSDAGQKILEGKKYTIDASALSTVPATGEILEGDKAEGKAVIYNKTTEVKEFKKGAVLIYEKDDIDYEFTLDKDTEVPARTDVSPSEIKAGSAEANITAKDIGSKYNLKKDTKLSVKGYKTAEFEAAVSSETKGGNSETVKVISAEDLKKLDADLRSKAESVNVTELKKKLPLNWALIEKSVSSTQPTVTLNKKAGDKAEEASGSISAKVEGLAYSSAELTKIVEKIAQELVPQEYTFNSVDKNYATDWLTGTDEAQMQVTFRFYVTPKINEDDLKNQIKGKTLKKAEEALDKVTGVEKVEITATPGILGRLPSNISKIEIKQEISD